MLPKQLSLAALWLAAILVGCGSEPSAAEYLERARASESEGKLRTASIEVRNSLKSDANNPDARLLLGSLQLRTGDPAGAEMELTRARELGAVDADTLHPLAVAMLRQGKFDELKALKGDGLPAESESSLLAARAFAHLAVNDIEAASADANRALALGPGSTEVRLVLARLDAVKGDIDGATDRLREALAAYDESVTRSDRSFQARLKRAQLQLERGDNDAALTDLDALSEAGVKLPAIDIARGQLDFRKGDLSAAQLRFENALKSAPDFPYAQGGLALTHLALGNAGQAEQYGKQMMAATNGSDSARRLLGAIRFESGRYALAAETVEPLFRTAEAADPFAARLMSTSLLKLDRHDEAVERMLALARVITSDIADSVESPLALARLPSQELLGDVIGAADQANAIETKPAESILDENDRRIAQVIELLGRGDNEAALEEAETLLTSMPDSAVPHNLIGRVHAARGRMRPARASFEQALDIDSRNVTALKQLAELDLQESKIDSARVQFEKALQGDGDSEEVLLRLAQLEAQARDEPAMLDWIERARNEHPNSAAPIVLLARYRVSRAEHELALAELDNLDERQPNVTGWHYFRAQTAAGLNDSGKTLQHLEKALELAPKHVPSLLAMTNIEIQRRDFDAAEARIDNLRDLIPGRAELDTVVARLASAKESADGTGPAKGVPSQLRTEGAMTAARDLYTKDQPEQATKLLETWLEANPTDIAVRLTLANTYAAGERVDEGFAQYETLLEGDEEALPAEARLAALNNLAWYLRESAPERALDVTPDSVATLDTLAMIHLGQGDNTAAKVALDRATAIGVDDPTIRYHGAQIEASLDTLEAARALLVPLVDENLEFAEADAARALLDDIGR